MVQKVHMHRRGYEQGTIFANQIKMLVLLMHSLLLPSLGQNLCMSKICICIIFTLTCKVICMKLLLALVMHQNVYDILTKLAFYFSYFRNLI